MGSRRDVRRSGVARTGDLLLWAVAGLLGVIGAWALASWTPSLAREDTVCLLRRATGLACPGCGMGRAAAALARGEWSAATALHPLVWVLVVELPAIWVVWGGTLWGWWRAPEAVWVARVAAANAALFVVVWIARALA